MPDSAKMKQLLKDNMSSATKDSACRGVRLPAWALKGVVANEEGKECVFTEVQELADEAYCVVTHADGVYNGTHETRE